MKTVVQWDNTKAASNERKHRVSFEEAQQVLWDEGATECMDESGDHGEDRFVRIGVSVRGTLVVVYSEVVEFDCRWVRIISARLANENETALRFPGR